MAPNLLRKAGQAVALNAIANWTTLIGSFLSIVIIARILTPEDYGVFVMALMVVMLPEVIASGTLGDSLVQRKDLRPGHINSVFLQSMTLSIAAWGLLVLLAPWIAHAFGEPSVAPVLIVTGAILPIGAVMSVPAAILQRDLRYKEITVIDILGTVTAAIVGIILALMWRNEWALVGMELSRRIVRVFGFLYFAKWVPNTRSSWPDFLELIRFNLANGASKVLQTFDQMLPKTLIGMTLGSHAVGVFNLPERLFQQANQALIAPFAAVAMPVASAMQDNRETLHQAMDSAIRMSALLAYPTFMGAFVVAPVAIPVVFGEQWAPSVPIFQIYMVIGLRAPITAIILGVFRGVGRPDVVAWITLTSIIATSILLAFTYQYGIVAIALGLLAKQVITFVLSTWMIQRVVGFTVIRQLLAGSAAFFASCVMGLAVWLFMDFVPDLAHPLLHVVATIVLGALIYPVALYFFMPRLGRHILRAVRILLSGQPREALKTVRGALTEQGI
ncbi:lipopolysaccharide biosynthesis protein [Hyphomonas jannaschiana]|jgi:O-antigen/teichoic acid export membrane protein|uniref:Polysaccharide biosynthesis protein n=1 Tax=Hyphomonas jannaschiana VP2 TaxID=1280952 RepID=A0A059F763_9PROT|nr:lipopolysaccharide biosynthesis protein [Hyphomonas jannaschiana]KCZ83918.1 polysaccharide biosynthesis protein [Hyphomonas jannaschiana VP2]